MKHSDQEAKQPSKQQEPICPVASKMQNGHMLVAQLAEWCGANNLSLNVEKTKEVVMDFRRRNSTDHPPLTIDSSTVEKSQQH